MKSTLILLLSLICACNANPDSQICTQICHELDTEEAVQVLKRKVGELETEIEEERAAIHELKQDIFTRCAIRYKGKCFWTVMQPGMTQEQAEAACASANGAKTANIYDQVHYNLIVDYMRPRIPYDDHRDYVWIGMKYDYDGDRVTYDNGTVAPYVHWHSGYPNKRTDFLEMCFLVERDPNDAAQGMYNQWVTTTKKGVLCEI